jgi:hypothetical protein
MPCCEHATAGDHLHPNDLGYEAMARAIPLGWSGPEVAIDYHAGAASTQSFRTRLTVIKRYYRPN